ncbi:MaoC/PaaZ C-terminal domain-containing protein [Bradyrhizobium sp. 1.29L]
MEATANLRNLEHHVNLEAVRNFRFNSVSQDFSRRDTILYALGLGFGSDALDPDQLRFLLEDRLVAVPSICCVLAHPGRWVAAPELAIDWIRLLHGEQTFEIHHPIPPEGSVKGDYQIAAVEDKGVDKGAILHLVKTLSDAATGTRLATVRSVLFLRGDGGCGGFGDPGQSAGPLPGSPPALTLEIPTLPQSALIYRLSGDYNPIHADPEAARKAGFERPILHGLCTFGVATRAILSAFAGNAPERLQSLSARFSRPVFPGETIRTEFFPSGDEIRFRSIAVERNLVVLDRGTARLTM